MAYVVTAKWIAREGEESAVADAIGRLIGPSLAEPGNLVYQPHRDPEDPRVFFFYEQYVDEAAFAAHAESAHLREYGRLEAGPHLASRERSIYETW
jgi:quinol monooxygenase YgiN